MSIITVSLGKNLEETSLAPRSIALPYAHDSTRQMRAMYRTEHHSDNINPFTADPVKDLHFAIVV